MNSQALKSPQSFSEAFCTDDGVDYDYALPFTDRQASARIVVSGDMVLVDSRTETSVRTAPWGHTNSHPSVELNFMLKGSLHQTQSGLLNQHLYTQGYHNWLFNPESSEQNQLIGTGQFRILSIHVKPARMVQLLTDYVPELDSLAKKIDQGTPFVRHTPALGFSPRISYLLDKLWDSPQPAGLKRLYIDSLTLELICQQCALFLPNTSVATQPSITTTDRDKLQQARSVLLQRLSNPPSLAELARLCQLNEFSLKRGFQQLFGTSVFGFVQEQRLELAQQLIYAGEKTIAEIAYELGYAHPQHFHRRFKQRFGITPKQLVQV